MSILKFETTILKFGQMGEKTGWTYIFISKKQANQLNPSVKKSYRVKGKLDEHPIKEMALIPMGEGDFIMVLNAEIRKRLRKIQGAKILVQIELDNKTPTINAALLECLQDEPPALSFFKSLKPGHQNYFSKWVDAAKTESTKAKRIAVCINALAKKWDYGLMIRNGTEERKELNKIN